MHLKSEVLQARDEDVPVVREMERLMREDLDSRYSEKAERVMDLACFIDPRFKGGFSEDVDNTGGPTTGTDPKTNSSLYCIQYFTIAYFSPYPFMFFSDLLYYCVRMVSTICRTSPNNKLDVQDTRVRQEEPIATPRATATTSSPAPPLSPTNLRA